MDVNNISISQAWSYATSFFSGRAAEHAIALIGVGTAIAGTPAAQGPPAS